MKNKIAAVLLIIVALILHTVNAQLPEPTATQPVHHHALQKPTPSTEGVRGIWLSKTKATDPSTEGVRGIWLSKTKATDPSIEGVRGIWLS